MLRYGIIGLDIGLGKELVGSASRGYAEISWEAGFLSVELI